VRCGGLPDSAPQARLYGCALEFAEGSAGDPAAAARVERDDLVPPSLWRRRCSGGCVCRCCAAAQFTAFFTKMRSSRDSRGSQAGLEDVGVGRLLVAIREVAIIVNAARFHILFLVRRPRHAPSRRRTAF